MCLCVGSVRSRFNLLDDVGSWLQEVNEQLKRYGSVNRKALDQFLSFNEQRQLLLARQQEMDKDNAAIQQLIHSLDQQKEEVALSSTT